MEREKFDLISFLKLLGCSLILGIFGGLLGALFSYLVSLVTGLRTNNPYLIYFLPLGGIVIVLLYKLLRLSGQSTNGVIDSADGENKISPLLSVGIISASLLSHLFGASVGREGAAIQIGGSLSVVVSKIFKISENHRKILVRVGLAAVFSAVFGTPIAAFLFALELVTVGRLHLKSALPSLLGSFTAFLVSHICGAHAERFNLSVVPDFSPLIALKTAVLVILTSLLSIVFCYSLRYGEEYAKKLLKNQYIRIIVGGFVIILLTLAVGNNDYNGAGISVIERVFHSGEFKPEAFVLKLVFTVVSVSAGFKGGEIVPTLFIGALFGAFMSSILGIPVAFAAALCMVLLFCGVTNCPLASIALAFEMFSGAGFWYFVPAVALCFVLSGNISLYKSQRIALPYNFFQKHK